MLSVTDRLWSGSPLKRAGDILMSQLYVVLRATNMFCTLKMLSTDVVVVTRHSAPMKGARSTSTQKTPSTTFEIYKE